MSFEPLEDRCLLTMIAPVSDTSTFPYSAAVHIVSVWDTAAPFGEMNFDWANKNDPTKHDQIGKGSGAMIGSHHALTVAHVVDNASRGGRAKWVFVHPGRDGTYDRPFGEVRATGTWVPDAFNNDLDYITRSDWAVIELDRNIGNFTGWFDVGYLMNPIWKFPDHYNVNVLHYPLWEKDEYTYDGFEQQYSSGDMWLHELSSLQLFPGPFYTFYGNEIWTAPGSSGSPLFLDDDRIVGVLAGGYEANPGDGGSANFTRLTMADWAEISDILEESSTPGDRPVLVDYDQWFDASDSHLSSSNVHTGSTVTVWAKVFNAGTAAASNVKVRFWLSDDSTISDDDVVLGETVIGEIAPLAYRNATIGATFPTLREGSNYVLWRIDPANTVFEYSTLLHDVGLEGEYHGYHHRGSLWFDVDDDAYEENDYRGAAEYLAERTWLSTKSGKGVQYDADWYEIMVPDGYNRIRIDLQFNARFGDIDLTLRDAAAVHIKTSSTKNDNEFLDVYVPNGGTYYLVVDGFDDGNTYDLRWEALQPADLVGTAFSVSGGNFMSEDEIQVQYRLQNNGAGYADDVAVKFYISTDATIDPNTDRYLGRTSRFAIGRLDPGAATGLLHKTVKLPRAGEYQFWNGDGTYYVGMVIDPDDLVPETDETNNSNRGDGLDFTPIDVTVYPYGQVSIIQEYYNLINIWAFDRAGDSGNTLDRVEVTIYPAIGYTEPGVGPYSPSPSIHQHTTVFNVGPFQFAGFALPQDARGEHTHPVQYVEAQHTFTGAEMAPIVSDGLVFSLPNNVTTTTDWGHVHDIDWVPMKMEATYYYTPPPPDVRGLSFSLSKSDVGTLDAGLALRAGEKFKVEYSVRNDGAGPTKPFYVGLYLSEDDEITTSDYALGSPMVYGLDPGETHTDTLTLQLPHPAHEFWNGNKQYYIGLVADSQGELDESDESNNAGVVIGLDHQVVDVTVLDPGTFAKRWGVTDALALPQFDTSLGTLTRVEVAVQLLPYPGYYTTAGSDPAMAYLHRHQFDFDAGPFHIEAPTAPAYTGAHAVQASPWVKQAFEGTELAAFLAGNQVFTLPRPIESPRILDHTHELGSVSFMVDTMFYFDNPPDLVGESFALAAGPMVPGEAVDVGFRLRNDGLKDASSFDVRFYLSTDTEITPSDHLLGSYRVAGLAKGASSDTLSTSLLLPPADDPFFVGDADYTIGMIVDSDDEIGEDDESNNANLGTGIDQVTERIDLPEPGVPVELGSVVWHELAGLSPAGGDLWYRVEATRQGPLTAWASAASGESVRLTLYDTSYNLLDRAVSTTGTARADCDVLTGEVLLVRLSGETSSVDLKLANVIRFDGSEVNVFGGNGDDRFSVRSLSGPEILVNGIGYELDAWAGVRVNIDGGPGNDSFFVDALAALSMDATLVVFDGGAEENTATLWGTSDDEKAVLRPGSASLKGPRYQFVVTNTNEITLLGGGGTDVAVLHDDPVDVDTFEAYPNLATLSGNGYSNQVASFRYVNAYSTQGNNDVAYLHDDPQGDDTLKAWPDDAKLYGYDYLSRALSFRNVYAYGTAGNNDVAMLFDRPNGIDTFSADPHLATLSGDGYSNQAASFRYVHAYSTPGNDDVAYLHDDPSEPDELRAWPDQARLLGADHYNRALSFRNVYAYGTPGNNDVAMLFDKSDGIDTFLADPHLATLSGDGYSNQVASFRYVHAYSTPGYDDSAYLYDDPNGDDRFRAWPDQARLFGADHYNQAFSFRNVYAYGTPGNNDVAVLLDSSGNDTFEAWPDRARLFGPGYSNEVGSFRYVHAFDTAGGTDVAWLYGSAARDVFVANARFSKLRGADFYNRAVSFEQVYAYGGGGRDVAVLYDAVLETGINDPPPSAAAVAWLQEFTRLRLRSTEPGSDETIVNAVDQVFTAYWE